MKSRTQQQWRALFEQQTAGDLSVAAFCKEQGIGPSYFYKRKSDLSGKSRSRESATSRFIKVKPPQTKSVSASPIKLQHQQTHLHFPASISAFWLAEFVKALA